MKVAQIGYGRWGRNLYRALTNISEIKQVMICDPYIDLDEDEFNLITFNEILNDETIKGVVIATPAETHFDYVTQLIQANKNIFCEKPLCFSSEEVLIIEKLINEHKTVLIVGHTFLFNDSIEFIKKYIQKNNLNFKTISGKYCSYGTNIKDIDVLWDFGPHVISIVNYILGSSPTFCTLNPMSYRDDGKLESCYIYLEYDKPKTSAVFELSWLNIDKKREVEFNNYKTLLRWNDLEVKRPVQIYEKEFNKENRDGVFEHFHILENKITVPSFVAKEPLVNELKYFIDCLENREYKNLKSGLEFSNEIIKNLEKLSKQY